MNPQQDQPSNIQPPVEPVVPTTTKKKRRGLALLLLIGPSVLFILTVMLAAIANLIFSSMAPETTTTTLFPENPAQTIVNVIVFLMGTVAVVSWLPGIIIGIILLNKK